MENRYSITRDITAKMKAYIAGLLKDNLIELRGERSDTFLKELSQIDFTVTTIPESVPFDGLFSDDVINTYLDRTFKDLLIRYTDAYALEDIYRKLIEIFNLCIYSAVNKISNLKAKSEAYESVLFEQSSEYNKLFYNTFIANTNTVTGDSALSITPQSGLLKLGGAERNYFDPNLTDITIETLSKNCELIYESSATRAYDNNPAAPYYQNYIVTGYPDNSEVGVTLMDFDAAKYPGIVNKISIRFSGVFPLNNVVLLPFSIGPVDILDVKYVNEVSSFIVESMYKSVTNLSVTASNHGIELNFKRIFASEIYIYLHTNAGITLDTNKNSLVIPRSDKYLAYAKTIMDRVLPNGYLSSDPKQQIAQLTDDIRSGIGLTGGVYQTGNVSYVFGLYQIMCRNIEYNNYGILEDTLQRYDQYLTHIGYAMYGTPDRISVVASDTILDACSVLSVAIDDVPYYLGTSSSGYINDGNAVEREHGKYKLRTHFTGKSGSSSHEFDNWQFFYDGAKITPTISDFTFGDRVTIVLEESWCNERNIYAGSIITMRYPVISEYEDGTSYLPHILDISRVFGIPTRTHQNLHATESSSIYLKQRVTTVLIWETSNEAKSHTYAVGDYLEYLGNIYRCVEAHTINNVNGAETLDTHRSKWIATGNYEYILIPDTEYSYSRTGDMTVVGVTKSRIATADTIVGMQSISSATKYYIDESEIVMPVTDFFYGSIDEPVMAYCGTQSIDGTTYYTYRLPTSYQRDTLTVYVDGVAVSTVRQYDIETGTTIVDKSLFWLTSNIGVSTLCASYIPLYNEYLSEYMNSTIAKPNESAKYELKRSSSIKLTKAAYLDWGIINSYEFETTGGVYYLKRNYSTIYEPIIVYVNGKKAVDVTDYTTGNPKIFSADTAETIEFYYDGVSRIIFNVPITGSVLIYFYTGKDRFIPQIEMFKSNYASNEYTPEIANYAIYVNTQR